MVTSNKIKELRDKTSISIMACKKALEDAGGDINKAILLLRKQGLKVAEKKSERELKAGIIESYIHSNKQIGVLVEVRSETDFVAKNDAFRIFAYDIAMHVAASDPQHISIESIDKENKESIKKVFEDEVSRIDKPEDIKKNIIEGKLDAYLKERTLLEQSYIKNPDIIIKDYLNDMIQKFGENIEITRFIRYSMQ